MPWIRLGQLYRPTGADAFARSHASLPCPYRIEGDRFRVLLSTRDIDQRSHAAFVDIELGAAPRVVSDIQLVLGPGSDGAFDDSGIGVGSVVEAPEECRLYYMGWNLGVRAPWRNAIGFARAPSIASAFQRFSPGPILDRSPEDPYTLSYPWVLRIGPEDWRMWYGSNLSWGASSADMSHVVKVATSKDGVRWTRDGATVIGFATADETAIARPSVVRIASGYLMAFACRGERYRIGAAWSPDAVNWTRCDDVMGLGPSDASWESEATCYPALFHHRGQLWLAYNGNGYGATGFGMAVWEGSLPA